ncbi:MAG: hypothetical protein HZA58_07395 [Acidimicrobiia bacterium]|nr:hypothetical protein [Acidimicrobiia bacterium]
MTKTARAGVFIAGIALAACGGGSPAGSTTPPTTLPATTTTFAPDPAYVPPECAGTEITTTSVSISTTVAPQSLSEQQQSEVVAAIDAAVREHYLYPDFNGVDWEGAVAALVAEVATGLDTSAFYERLDELIASLADEHSHLETPAEVLANAAELAASNDFVGIGGLLLPVESEGLVALLAVFPGSAADHAGLAVHDSILAADGVPLVNAEAYRALRGPECSLVVLTVRSPGGEARTISAVRSRVTGGIPITSRLVPDPEGRSIGYVFIPTLGDGSADEQVPSAIEGFGPLDGLIVDLRGNGGGSSSVLEPLLALFTSGTVGGYRSGDGSRVLEITADEVHNSQTVPLVVLIDEDTVSYAEVLAGTLAAMGRATLIGETTDGNVETLRGYDLPDGSKLWLAAERFYPFADPDADWERDGIVPDVAVVSEWEDFTFETDPALGPALAALATG